MTGIYVGLFLYIVVTFGISVYTGRNAKTSSSFIVGKRNYGSVVTALSMGTTLASGFAFLGMVGMGYTMGLVASWQCIFGVLLEFIFWYVLAHRMRRLSIETGSVTPVEALSKLHGDPNNLIKICGGLMIGLFMMFFLAGQFTAGSKAAVIMNLDPTTVAIGIAVLSIAYIFLGGVNAAMWTNAIQGLIMIFCFFIVLVMALSKVGGFSGLFAGLSVAAPETIQWNNGRPTGAAVFFIVNYWLGSSLGFFAQPQAIQKFLTINSDKKIRSSCMISCLFNFIRQLGPVFIGMCCRLIYPNLADPETGMPQFIVDFLPNLLGGILMAGIFAAIMSTTEALLLHSTSEISRNFLQEGIWKNKKVSDKAYGKICKILTVLIGIGGLSISLFGSDGVFTLIIFAFSGLFTSMGPSLYFGLFWKKCTSQGILAGVLTGIPATAIWYYFLKPAIGIHEAFSVIVPIAAVVIVSLATQNAAQEENWAERLKAMMKEGKNLEKAGKGSVSAQGNKQAGVLLENG